MVKSAAKIDHLHTGGTLLNQRFTPDFFEDDLAIRKHLLRLVRGYFRMNGHHIEFNVIDSDVLRDAPKIPNLPESDCARGGLRAIISMIWVWIYR